MHSLTERRAGSYREKSLVLVPSRSTLMQMRTPNPCILIDPKDCPQWSEWSCSDWLVKMLMGDIAAQIQLEGEASVLFIEIGFQELLKGWLRWQKHSIGRWFCAGFSLKYNLHVDLSLIHISEPTRPPLISRMPSSA